MSKVLFENDDPTIRPILNDIASRINGVLPDAWGFLLMLFEYGTDAHPGNTFYACSADRADGAKMLREWLDRQEREINPDHPITQQLRQNWHKIVAILLMKFAEAAGGSIVITEADVRALGARDVSVAAKDTPDGLRVWLVDTDEARRLAADGRALEG